jgi:hypothetical protein
MRTYGLLLVAIFYSRVEAIGQIYFDNLYGRIENNEGCVYGGTQLSIDGYISLAYSHSDEMPYWFEVDNQGNMMSEISIDCGDSLSMNPVALIAYDDSAYFGLCGLQNIGGTSSSAMDFGLMKFNRSGVIEWVKNYGRADTTDIPQGLKTVNPGRFCLIGQAAVSSGQIDEANMFLIVIDSTGNELYQRQYGGIGYEGGKDLLQTPDHGFLLLGWTRSYGAGQRDFYLVKTDSVGNQQWQKTYGGSGEDVGSSILALSNGNFLLTGGGTNSAVTTAQGYLYEVTPQGQQVWHRSYSSGDVPGDHFFKSIQLSDGSIVSVGLAENSSTGGNAGWLVKTDSVGELIWQKVYDKNQHTDLFYSVLLANDGGFLLSGQARNLETNSQDAWLLKVDSVGCPYPNCTVGVDEVETGKVVVDVWPNPAGEYVRLQVTGNRSQQEASVRVTDMQGHTIQPEYEIASEDLAMTGLNGQYLEIDVRNWSDGLYIFTVNNGTDRARVRVVVQH